MLDSDGYDWGIDGLQTLEFQPIILAQIAILDSDLGDPVPVGGIAGDDGDLLQAQPKCYAPLVWLQEGFLPVLGETTALDARRKSKLAVKALFTNNAATAVIRVKYKDSFGNIVLSEEKTVNNSGIADDNGNYISELLIADTYGIDWISIILISVTAESVAFSTAVI